jgi:hypothetical protein
MSVLIRRCVKRSYLVEELVETWQIEHSQAMFARDLEELVQECLELSGLLTKGWQSAVHVLFDEQFDDLDTIGKMLKVAIDKSIGVFRKVEDLISEAIRKHYDIEGAEAFRRAVSDTVAMKKEVEKQWPAVNHRMIQESIAAYSRGDYQTAEDMLYGLEGHRPENNQ